MTVLGSIVSVRNVLLVRWRTNATSVTDVWLQSTACAYACQIQYVCMSGSVVYIGHVSQE